MSTALLSNKKCWPQFAVLKPAARALSRRLIGAGLKVGLCFGQRAGFHAKGRCQNMIGQHVRPQCFT